MNWAKIGGILTCLLGFVGLVGLPRNTGTWCFTAMMIASVFLFSKDKEVDHEP